MCAFGGSFSCDSYVLILGFLRAGKKRDDCSLPCKTQATDRHSADSANVFVVFFFQILSVKC